MKLSKIYSNQKNFKNIEFNLNGLNVVWADVTTNPLEKKNSHDLGKTKLADILDFLLLKKVNKNHFLIKIKKQNSINSIFEDYIFYLEILLNSGKFLTIKRGVSANTKISFSLNEQRTNGFHAPANWDFEDAAIESAKDILSDFLDFDFFQNKPYDYRKAIGYSLRTQNDFKDVYELNKFENGKDKDWKPFMFDLLGFSGKLLQFKYDNDAEIEEIQRSIDILKKEYSVRTESRDEIVAEKSILENKYRISEIEIDKFNFYEQDKELIKHGVDELENKISLLNSESYILNYELEKLRNSIKNNFSFDIKKIKKIFEESKLYFPENLEADYNQLIEFNKKLTTERNKILNETIQRKVKQLNEVNIQLNELNQDRETLLSSLTDTDTFTKFKFYQKELAKFESKIITLDEKLKIIDSIINKEREIENLQNAIKSTVDTIKTIYQNTGQNEKYQKIRTLFSDYYKFIMDEDAYIAWNINSNNNVEFLPPKVKSKFDIKRDTAKDEGNTYRKILCIAFDLAILTTYNDESFFRFVYHDDALSQQDNGIKNRLLSLIHKLTTEFDLQYILSAIKADLPTDQSDRLVEFSESVIILKLNDFDASGTLFGFEF